MKPARWCRFITTASTMTTLLSRLCACAQTAPIYALQVKRMLDGRCARRKEIRMIGKEIERISKEMLDWMICQPSVKEESITDSLLYNVSKITPLIKYKAFSRNEESKKTGADWEWWFHFTTTAIKFRVQAKKINIPKKNYRNSISYKGNTYNQYKKLT
jgi:hypothetical protein